MAEVVGIEGGTVAVSSPTPGTVRKPDPIQFDAQLRYRASCGGWTNYAPPDQNCGPIDWSLVPMIEERSGVILECIDSKWRVVDLN